MDYDHKTEKSTIINLCGVTYKAKHQSSASINNRFLLCLAQIKYFIKVFLKVTAYCARKIIYPIFEHVFTNYEEPVLLACSTCLVIGMFFTVLIPIIDLLLSNDKKTPHSEETHDPNATISSIILTHILVYSLYTVGSIVGIILGTFCLSHICMVIKQISIFIYNILNILISFTTNIISKYYSKIPEVEQIDPLDIV